ncbi:class A basic helix-loop-helix protein 15 isoform X1 [Oryzias melastigma]|uniref:class A basic helix-loop-helix protein 15 isoform X1 n=1 Tax=Oryzias melastigma TaxID=30732 RepID=UPI00168D6F2B|nr:class A basic helix-loop-helix protein 15 isoform X1 [Oryzias melastigma]
MGSNSRGVDGFGGGVTLDGCLSIALCCRKATCLPGERWKCELFVLPLPSRPSHPVFASTLLCIPFHPTPPGICPVSASESSPAWRSMAAAEGRMHELKNIKVGATLVINKDGLSWFSGRRSCGNKITRREAEPQRLMSSGETEEEQQSLTCVCILHPNERNVNRKPWRHTDQRSSFLTQSAYFPLSDHDSQKKLQESVFAFPDPVFPESLKTQKGNILSTKDISSVIPNNLNVSNRHNKNTVSGCIILCDGWELFHPIRNWGKFPGHCWTMDNMFMLKPSIIQKSLSPITEDDANGNVINLQSHLQMCRNSNDPGESAGQDGNGKRKKSVSFDEDVTVYLFDQEIPTVELHSESDPFQPFSCFHHEEDSGWEWEDDFQTLENTHHFQTDPHTISLPSLEWTSTSRPKNRALPHTCLVLTYIPESDLEL